MKTLEAEDVSLDGIADIKKRCLSEICENPCGYIEHTVNDEDTFVIDRQFNLILRGVHLYFDEKQWDNQIGDFLIYIMANALKIHIDVYQKLSNQEFSRTSIISGNAEYLVKILRSDNHYDAIIMDTKSVKKNKKLIDDS